MTMAHLSSATSSPLWPGQTDSHEGVTSDYFTESTFRSLRSRMHKLEIIVLRTTGFAVHVAVPHSLSINYLQVLEVLDQPSRQVLAKSVVAHLNDALLSPQMLYATHQPNALAVAAIYLATRKTGFKLPEVEWWEVFDVDREELGFLVLAMQSLESWVQTERAVWTGRKLPLDVEGVVAECERRQLANGE